MSTQKLNTRQIKEQVSLTELLQKLGFRPARSSGNERIYTSMIRDSDTKTSFSVNAALSVWYDHGLGKGGNIIDFGLAFWPHHTFPEVLAKINDLSNLPAVIDANVCSGPRRRRAVKLPNYRIEEIKELGNNDVITEYLKSKGIYKLALNVLKEVYYYVEDEKNRRKQFYAAGWQNELGCWEVRNKYFEGCLGNKAITFIEQSKERLSVFVSFINYLSWLTENPFSTDSILVLNTITLIYAASKKAGEFLQVAVYFDQDIIGRKATVDFIILVPQAKDGTKCYEGYNDYNEKIVSERTGYQLSH